MARKLNYKDQSYYDQYVEPTPTTGIIGMVFVVAGLATLTTGWGLGVLSLGIILMAIQSVTSNICRAIFRTHLYGMDRE